ncbi:MAG: ABC-type sugar transport system, periplasmic component [Symbiobacteriaceae bacterium]|nr:ABC-type sugar transport system, periplasmic component [Symbiobacteriaceae bacterium]
MGMNWRKVLSTSLTAALAISLVTGCGGKKEETPAPGSTTNTPAPAPQEKVQLEFWAHWASAERRPTIDKIIQTWNEKNPNIQVNYTAVPFDQIITKFQAGVTAGNAPDVAVLDVFTTQQRAAKKQNLDLSALGADSLKNDFFAAPWSAGTLNGKQYSLPFYTDTRLLFYNKAAFKEVGLDPNKGPVSWDDLWAMADKLDKKSGKTLERVGFHPNFGSDFALWILNNKSAFWDAKMEKPQINNPVSVETLDWMKKWNDRYGNEAWSAFKATFQGGANDAFISGKIAMKIDVATFAAQIKKYAPNMEYGMVPIPTKDGKQHPATAWSGGFQLEIPVNTKHPKEAYAFAKYLATEGAAVWAAEQYSFPGYKKAAEGINDPVFKAMLDNMPNTIFYPRPLSAMDYGTAVQKAVDDVMSGKAATKAALDEAQKAVEQMVKDNTGK